MILIHKNHAPMGTYAPLQSKRSARLDTMWINYTANRCKPGVQRAFRLGVRHPCRTQHASRLPGGAGTAVVVNTAWSRPPKGRDTFIGKRSMGEDPFSWLIC